MRKKKLILLFLCVFAVSCAINPVTGKRELSLISEQEELSLGKQTDGEIRIQYGLYDDAALDSYVKATGSALAPHSHRPDLPYQFAVLDSPVVNAFAVPGGYIYVTRGILALMSTEAELAAVLGHELGHVNARHSVRRMSQQLLLQTGMALGSAVNETFAKIAGVAGIGVQLLFLKYSRDDERQADALGVQYTRSAGFDPSGVVPFFEALEKMGDLSGGQSLPGFLSTHPLTSERIQNVRAMLQPDDEKLTKNAEAYLRKIENVVYGEDPRQGFTEGGTFYHPLLRFQFAFPQNWKLQNTPARVVIVSQDGNGAILLQAEKTAESLKDYAQKRAAEIQGGNFQGDNTRTVNGLSCYEQSFTITQSEQESLALRRSYIRKGDTIYVFSALCPATRFSGFENQFTNVVTSFQELTNPAYLQRAPKRLSLVRADGSQTIQDIFKKEGMESKLWPIFAVMNGLEPQAVPEKGRLIKVVR